MKVTITKTIKCVENETTKTIDFEVSDNESYVLICDLLERMDIIRYATTRWDFSWSFVLQ
jgi:hypothetical protein